MKKKNLYFPSNWGWLMLTPICFLLQLSLTLAQQKRIAKSTTIQIPMDASHWELSQKNAEFIVYKGVKALKSKSEKHVVVKDLEFTNGTIEFDVEPIDAVNSPFVSFYFRRKDTLENECVYLRMGRNHSEKRNDAIQYAPFVKGVNLWNLLNHFQGPAIIHTTDWNHVKLVVSDSQLRVYINDMNHPALEIPRMEGNLKKGSIAFDGVAVFANLIIRPEYVEDLPGMPGTDLTNHDANYLRHWFTSKPQWLVDGADLSSVKPPNDTTKWVPLVAERHALINVTRVYGLTPNSRKRYVWLKTKIRSEKDQIVSMQLGFCDDVSVFLNGGLLYTDKNTYWMPIRKNPDGRCDIRNSKMQLSLKTGDNYLMIALANYFYGWGIVARISSLDGIDVD